MHYNVWPRSALLTVPIAATVLSNSIIAESSCLQGADVTKYDMAHYLGMASQYLCHVCRLRIQAQQQKQKLTAKSQKKFGKRLYGSAGGAATSGLSSSLAFTPVQVSQAMLHDMHFDTVAPHLYCCQLGLHITVCPSKCRLVCKPECTHVWRTCDIAVMGHCIMGPHVLVM